MPKKGSVDRRDFLRGAAAGAAALVATPSVSIAASCQARGRQSPCRPAEQRQNLVQADL
jgi:TAT (twin-arginine translocation) pathway-exported protein